MNNKCALCGSTFATRLFHKDYICSKCISSLKNLTNNEHLDVLFVKENHDDLLNYETYAENGTNTTENYSKKK